MMGRGRGLVVENINNRSNTLSRHPRGGGDPGKTLYISKL